MEPITKRDGDKDDSNIGTSDAEKTPAPLVLRSLEQFMAERAEKKDDAYELSAYKAYMYSLGRYFKASATKPESVKQFLLTAEKLINQFYVGDPLVQALNAAYQGLLGPKPGDDLRLMIPDFVVDDHQWKHYQNGSREWGLFIGHSWQEVHKIIVYGAKLILVERAIQIDQGVKVYNTEMDGFVQFDHEVGQCSNSKKASSLIRIQIARDSKTVSGHGYPVPFADSGFPIVNGVYVVALREILSPDNNEMRIKK